MRNPTRLAVAMHEAGHAVVNLIDDEAPPIAAISLDPASGELKHVDTWARWAPWHMDGPAPDPATHAIRLRAAAGDLMHFLAGPIAEMRWRRYPRLVIQWGAREMAERCLGPERPSFGSDLDNVARRLRWSHQGGEREAFVEAWMATEATVASWLDVVFRLGRELHAAGELDEDAVSAFRDAHVAPRLSARRS